MTPASMSPNETLNKSVSVFDEVLRVASTNSCGEGVTAAAAAVGRLTSKELEEVRKLHNPPKVVRRTLEATFLLMNAAKIAHPPAAPDWPRVQRMLSDTNFLTRMKSYDATALRSAPALAAYIAAEYFGVGTRSATPPTLSRRHSTANLGAASPKGGSSFTDPFRRSATLRRSGQLTVYDEPLTFQRVHHASHATAALFKWCTAMVEEAQRPASPVTHALDDAVAADAADAPSQRELRETGDCRNAEVVQEPTAMQSSVSAMHLSVGAQPDRLESSTGRSRATASPRAPASLPQASAPVVALAPTHQEFQAQAEFPASTVSRPASAKIPPIHESPPVCLPPEAFAPSPSPTVPHAAFAPPAPAPAPAKQPRVIKATTEPDRHFELLVAFDLGYNVLTPEGEISLQTVAAMLCMRQQLSVELRGCAHQMENEAMVQSRFRVVEAFLDEQGLRSALSADRPLPVSGDETPGVICQLVLTRDRELRDYFLMREDGEDFPLSRHTMCVVESLESDFRTRKR
mmetsp:Transcript_87686/g.246339  ORF Transcript_87686/g.246339 Transcript_87686/m.246339 type:complete len:517 (+) Transcript_87686:88-1638(+)